MKKKLRAAIFGSITGAALLAIIIVSLRRVPSPQTQAEAASAAASAAAAAPLAELRIPVPEEPSFNPYIASSTLVIQNSGLVSEKLVELSPEMELSYRLAENIVSEGLTAIISLRSGCLFADGSPVTAADVAASLEAARTSGTYAARFANVQSLTVEDAAVTVSLAAPDSLFAYLCDIPVLKAGETASPVPTPSGRYLYGDGVLTANPNAPFPTDGPATLHLVPVASYDGMAAALTDGTIDLYATSGDEDAIGGNNRESFYRTNRLTFLGVNAGSDKPILSTAAGRSLLSGLLSRKKIASGSYYSRAYPALGALNSFYPAISGHQLLRQDAAPELAEGALTALGYTQNEAGAWLEPAGTPNAGSPLALSLLVYSGNTYRRYAAHLIADQLAEAGIPVSVQEADDFNAYAQGVASGAFELYIGEVKLYNNMDLSPFLAGGALSAGLAQTEELTAAYAAFRQDAAQSAAFEEAFAAAMPYIPLLWQNGAVVTRSQVGSVTSSVSSIYYSFQGLAAKVSP